MSTEPAGNEASASTDCSSRYTPAPWYAHHNGAGAYCIKTGTDYDTSPTICSRNHWRARAEESDANAVLIAAAPELAAALRELYDFGAIDSHHRYHDRSEQAFETAIQLLKRVGA